MNEELKTESNEESKTESIADRIFFAKCKLRYIRKELDEIAEYALELHEFIKSIDEQD